MVSKADVQAGKAFIRLYLKNDMSRRLASALKAAGARLQSFGRSAMMAGAGVTGAGVALLAPLMIAVKSFAAQGDTLDKMARRTGIAGSALAELSFAAEQSGADLDAFEKGLKRMQRTLTDATLGLSTAIDGLDMVGLSIRELENLSPDEQFQKIADGMAAIEDPSKKAAAAQMLFGRSGPMLIPMLNDLRALRQEARELGIIPSQEEIDNAAKVTDAINRVRRVVKKMFFDIGAGLAGPALEFLDVAKKIAMAVGKFAKRNAALLLTVAAIGTALIIAGGALTVFGAVIWGAGLALSALGSVVGVMLSPLGLLVAAVVGGAVAWLRFSESGKRAWASLKAAVMPIIETLRTTFGGVKDALMSGDWELAGKIAMTGLKLAVLQGLSAIQEAFPKTFGNILRVVGKIGDGIVMAWGKVTEFMTEQWNGWAKRTLDTVMGVASRIPQIWQQTVEGMANWMLEASAKGGVMGKAMSAVLGVDMAEEQARAERLNRELGLGPVDVLADAREAVKQYTDGLVADAEAIGGEPGTGKVSESLEAFLTKLESGTGIQDAAKELATLRVEAAKLQTKEKAKRAEEAGGKGAQPAIGAAATGKVPTAVPTGVALTATYSAAAARISGYQPGGGGPEEKAADGIAASAENTKQMLVRMGQWLQQNETMQSLYERFLAGWKVS